jgi:hypothetical protein
MKDCGTDTNAAGVGRVAREIRRAKARGATLKPYTDRSVQLETFLD